MSLRRQEDLRNFRHRQAFVSTLLASSKLTSQMFTTAAQLLDLTDSETPLRQFQYERANDEDSCD